jgi:uncharacterized protein YijF (DUF1287 family)
LEKLLRQTQTTLRIEKVLYPFFLFFVFFTGSLPLYANPGFSRGQLLEKAALDQTSKTTAYDPSYTKIPYPNGDVPENAGVCSDVIIRAYRSALGVDLQKLVHEDMNKHFSLYPQKWGLSQPDPNIDHRRVLNLQKFFERYGKTLPISSNPQDYQVGEMVTWVLPGNLPHIGFVSDQKTSEGTPLIIHNIGQGAKIEDILFQYKITGHYQY